MTDVVLCVPSCEGPVKKAFEVTGVTPVVSVSGRLNEITALEPAEGFAGAVINASAFPFSEAMSLCRQLRSRERSSGPVTPRPMAVSASSGPTPCRRCWRMGWPVSRLSYSSIRRGMASHRA